MGSRTEHGQNLSCPGSSILYKKRSGSGVVADSESEGTP